MNKFRKSFTVKGVSLILGVLLIFAVMPSSLIASASTVDEIEARQEELRTETEELESKLESLREDEEKAQEYSDTLNEKIELTEDKIDTAISDIKSLNSSITDLEDKLEESAQEYDDTMELFKERVRALYLAGDVGTIEILLNSTSLYDFSMKSELLKSVAERDKLLCEEITEYMEKTQEDKDELSAQKKEVANLKKQLESDQEELVELKAENDEIISDLQSRAATTQDKIDERAQEDADLQAELERLIEEQRKKEEEEQKRQEELAQQQQEQQGGSDETVYDPPTDGTGGSADFGWPLPGYGPDYITCPYGDGHNGLDIGAPHGTPIVAAQSGTVLNASYHDSWGNNVLIYHNGTYSTRYAHMSSMAVSVGETVSQGQVIGYVGDTGYSFGDHLHFEVYQDGYRVDPYPFL